MASDWIDTGQTPAPQRAKGRPVEPLTCTCGSDDIGIARSVRNTTWLVCHQCGQQWRVVGEVRRAYFLA